jgi:hypothetical protein
MKKTYIIAILSITCLAAFSQTNAPLTSKAGFSLDLGAPITEGYSFLAGGVARFEHPLKSDLSVTGSLGYTRVGYQKEVREALKMVGASTSIGIVPLKGGLKKGLNNNFYVQGESGLAFGEGTSFILSPRIGYEKPTKKGSYAASARYELWAGGGSFHLFSLGLEYNFPIRLK